MLTLTEAD